MYILLKGLLKVLDADVTIASILLTEQMVVDHVLYVDLLQLESLVQDPTNNLYIIDFDRLEFSNGDSLLTALMRDIIIFFVVDCHGVLLYSSASSSTNSL